MLSCSQLTSIFLKKDMLLINLTNNVIKHIYTNLYLTLTHTYIYIYMEETVSNLGSAPFSLAHMPSKLQTHICARGRKVKLTQSIWTDSGRVPCLAAMVPSAFTFHYSLVLVRMLHAWSMSCYAIPCHPK